VTDASRVSVVIPAYNAARTVVESVQSALDQTMSEIEVIVVDDGSADATAQLVGAIDDQRVRLLQQPNGGVSAARNAGIAEARCEWVAFLDADDLWLPRKLERQLELMALHPSCLASQGSAYFVDEKLEGRTLRRCIPVDDALLTFLRFQNLPNAASSWIVKRELLAEIGVFDPELASIEDWDFSLRLARYANPLCIDEPLTLYRVHRGNRSRDIDAHIEAGRTILGRIFADPTLPPQVQAHEREIYARFYTMLCGGSLRVGRWKACVYWGLRALRTDPRVIGYMAATPLRRAGRRLGGAAAPANV